MLLNYELNNVTLSNLDELSKRQTRLEKQRLCEMNELATECANIFLEMLRDEYGIYEILSYISETLSAYTLSSLDKVEFSRQLLEILSLRGVNLSESDFLQGEHTGERIAFVKSPLSDEAYDVFSQELRSARLLYCDSLSSSAKAVADGDAEYCILPFEEKGGARLTSVFLLISKYDLKINKVTPVFGPYGNADMRYALMAKDFTVPKIEKDDDRYLELRLPRDASVPLSELLFASEEYGASIYRINSLKLTEDNDSSEYYDLVLSGVGCDFALILTYLTLFSGAYTPVGIYKNLE